MALDFYKESKQHLPVATAYYKTYINGENVDFEMVESNLAFEKLLDAVCIKTNLKQISKDKYILNEPLSDLMDLFIQSYKSGAEYIEEVFFCDVKMWLRAHIKPIDDAHLMVTLIDISREKARIDELGGFFEVNLDLLCIADLEGKFVKLNKAWETTLGYKIDEMINRPFMSFVHPEDYDETLNVLKRLENKDRVSSFVNRYIAKDKSHRYIEWRSIPSGDLIYAAARDITEKVMIERALREEKERHELVMQGSNDGFWDWNVLSNELYLSRRWKEQLGYDEHEIDNTYESFLKLVYHEDRHYVQDQVASYLSNELDTYDITFRMVHKDTSIKFIRARGEVFRDEKGMPYRMAGAHSDITDLTFAQSELVRSEMKFRHYMEKAPIAILVANSQGKFIEVNHSACELFGYSKETLLKASIPFLLPMEEMQRGLDYYHLTKKNGVVEPDEFKFLKEDGTIIWCSILATKIDEDNIIAFCSDITSKKQSEVLLNDALIKADASNKAKSQFLANMSHEIRTPMNGVLGIIQLLEQERLSFEQQEMVSLMKKSSLSLLKVVNDVLDYSKIEFNRLQTEILNFDVYELVSDTITLFSPAANQKGLEILTVFDPTIPKVLEGDPYKIKQVLNNLIGNSIKFTDKGQVSLSVHLINGPSDENSESLIRFEVSDTGIGMTSEYLATIFEMFTQQDPSNTRKYGGTGLGLAICKGLIETLNGTISVESSPDKGSKFTFVIPLKMPHVVDEIIEKTQDAYSSLAVKQLHLLVAEDDETNALLLKKIIEKNGWRATVSRNGIEVVEAYLNQPFDAILMDVQMPIMDGYAATKAIRQHEVRKGKKIPIIALTANSMLGDREKCLAYGMDDYLSKPIVLKDFYTVMSRWIK